MGRLSTSESIDMTKSGSDILLRQTDFCIYAGGEKALMDACKAKRSTLSIGNLLA